MCRCALIVNDVWLNWRLRPDLVMIYILLGLGHTWSQHAGCHGHCGYAKSSLTSLGCLAALVQLRVGVAYSLCGHCMTWLDSEWIICRSISRQQDPDWQLTKTLHLLWLGRSRGILWRSHFGESRMSVTDAKDWRSSGGQAQLRGIRFRCYLRSRLVSWSQR